MITVSPTVLHLGSQGNTDLSIDTVIWFGDFNYRIGLTSEVARELIRQGDLERLYENDQVGEPWKGQTHSCLTASS